MRCKDFLALHSGFRDGVITDPSMARRMQQHQARCRSCSKQMEALTVGTQVLRELEPVEPSHRFRVNLRVRMALAKRQQLDQQPVFGWPASVAASLLVVTVILAGFAKKREDPSGAAPTRIVSNTANDIPSSTTPRLAGPEFQLPAFNQQVGSTRNAAPRVVFSISEDSGFSVVPAIR